MTKIFFEVFMELVNIAFFAKASQSSISQWSKPNEANVVLRNNELQFAMHTNKGDNEWWLCEFPFLINCRRIVVHNRKHDEFFGRSKNIKIFVSDDGRHWNLVYDRKKIFGYGKNSLSLDLNLDKKIKYIKITNDDYMHFSQVEIFVDKADNKDIRLVTNRQDGLVQRLLGIVHTWAVAQYCGFEWGFTWENNKRNDVFHDVLQAENTFSTHFLEAHYIKSNDLGNCEKELVFGGVYFTPHTHWIIPNNEIVDFGKIYRNIGFSDDIIEVKTIVNSLFLHKIKKHQGSLVAVHIRAGDIVYGRHRFTQQFVDKVVQHPFILDIVEKKGNNVLLVGQDYNIALAMQSRYPNISIVQDYYPENFASIQKIFFDIEVMALCDALYGGNSAPIEMAGKISNKQVINPHYQNSADENIKILKKYLFNENYLSHNIPKQSIAYSCSAYLYYGFNKENAYDLMKANNLARLFDSENRLYDLFDLFLQYRCAFSDVAEENVKRYIVQYGTFGMPILNFDYLYNKNKTEFTNTSNRVGYMVDLRKRIADNDNLPYAELLIGMAEYCLDRHESAKPYFLSFQKKTKNRDIPTVLQDFLRSNGL